MTEGTGRPDARDDGPEGPAAPLRDLEDEPSADFAERVQNRIHRREAAAHVTDLSSGGFLLVLVEFIGMIAGLFGGHNKTEGGSH